MVKWADYVISQANYNSNHKIENLKQLVDNGETLGIEEIVTRSTVIHNIKKGKSYVTAFNGLSGMKRGQNIRVYKLDKDFYLRIDKNKVSLDNLGPIPEIS